MNTNNNALGNCLLWGGIGFLTYAFLKEENHAQPVDRDILIKENFKYNPSFNKEEYGGNPEASNLKGSGKFNYVRIIQARRKFGLECYAASVVNIYKSLGIISPTMSRLEFELTYTNLYMDKDAPWDYKKSVIKSDYRIPKYYNDNLRGKYNLSLGQKNITKKDFAIIAKNISEVSNYSIYTGMRGKSFEVIDIRKEEIEKYLLLGYAIRFYTTEEGGHYVVATGLKKQTVTKNKQIIKILTDDTWYITTCEYDLQTISEPWIIKAA